MTIEIKNIRANKQVTNQVPQTQVRIQFPHELHPHRYEILTPMGNIDQEFQSLGNLSWAAQWLRDGGLVVGRIRHRETNEPFFKNKKYDLTGAIVKITEGVADGTSQRGTFLRVYKHADKEDVHHLLSILNQRGVIKYDRAPVSFE